MCPRGEIGRHNGLKIRAFLECQFESGRGHHFMCWAVNTRTFFKFKKNDTLVNMCQKFTFKMIGC